MTLPLWDLHGITINDPADGYHTESEVNAFLDATADVPRMERNAFFRAVWPHWNHVHFAEGGDNLVFQPKGDGTYTIDYYTPWSA